MNAIPHSFQAFLSSLELTLKQRQEANEQHIRLRTLLQQRLKVEDNFLSGSYARKTAIRPLNDIDIFVVLVPRPGFDPTIPIPTILGEIKGALDQMYPGKSALSQNRSVNIAFSGTGIAYDVVPAFTSRPGVYVVPDRQTGRWVKTNPKIHAQLATQADERASNKLKLLLKAVKHANVHHRKLARSFHLEVLSWKILKRDPGPFLDGLVTLLDGLARRIQDPCIDPANLGGDIRPEPDRCQAAQVWLTRMARLAAEAKALDGDKQTAAAHAKLREIFGPQWR